MFANLDSRWRLMAGSVFTRISRRGRPSLLFILSPVVIKSGFNFQTKRLFVCLEITHYIFKILLSFTSSIRLHDNHLVEPKIVCNVFAKMNYHSAFAWQERQYFFSHKFL